MKQVEASHSWRSAQVSHPRDVHFYVSKLGGIRMSFRMKAIAAAALSLATLATGGLAQAADLPVKAAKKAADLPFFLVIDDRVTFSYIFNASQPGAFTNTNGVINPKTTKQVYSFTHFDAWTYGTNFFTISMFKSDHNDPAGPCTATGVVVSPAAGFAATPTSCAGATEIYGLFRSTFGWNEIFNTKAFTQGPLHNISFEVGMDANTENRYFGAAKRDVVAGLQFAFDLPYKGYFNVAPLVYWEFANHNSFSQCGAGWSAPCIADGNTSFKPTWAIETQLLYGPRLPAAEHAVFLDQRPRGVVRQEGHRHRAASRQRCQQRLSD
ncbi:hypothetical protein ACVWZW_000054 [Bradyrhizobium sp. F1.13.4]